MAMPMQDDALLTLTHWLSPAFPTGGFAYSQGLEWAIRAGDVTGPASLQDWLSVLLHHGSGRQDAILLHCAHRGCDVAAMALAFAASAERRQETCAQGAAFAATVRAVWGLPVPDAALPVAVGLAARAAGLAPVPVAQVFLHGMVTGLTLAAQRLMRLGQTDAHRIIAALAQDCALVAYAAADLTADDLGGAALLQDMAAMHHETQQPRMFRS